MEHNLKDSFLQKLKKNNGTYKKYLLSPLRYAGGKSWAVGYVIENLPKNINKIVSPFFGGGAIEFALAKELNIQILGFDIFNLLVNYWYYQFNYQELLYNELKQIKPNKDNYYYIKQKLKDYIENKIDIEPLKLAAYFYFNHNLSYGPNFLGWASKIYLNEKKYYNMLNKVKNFNIKNITIECKDFKDVLPKYKNYYLICDPPYYLDNNNTIFTGIYPSRNHPIYHKNFNHELLYELLKEHNNGFILFYNNNEKIKKWYSNYRIIEIPINYTLGLGEVRIGKNRKKRKTNKKIATELMIIKN